MDDDLLSYYNSELTFIRQFTGRYAQTHGKVADRLRINPNGPSDDPHVERLIDAFAYLTARLRRKLDDELPEITTSLLDVLYPHYQAPIPSMAIAQFHLDASQAQLTTSSTVPRGTELETEPVDGEPCRFRTAYPVALWPIEVKLAQLTQAPFPAPPTSFSSDATAVLRLVLNCPGSGTTFDMLGIDRLRFFLRGQPQHVHLLYELIFNHTIGMALATSATDRRPLELGRECLGQVGFGREEGLLPYPARSFVGYRLLTEYFVFPQKFHFVELTLPPAEAQAHLGGQVELYLFLDRVEPELARHVTAGAFLLGCTPIVNLYKHRAEPIALTHTTFEYKVDPDRRRPLGHEVYSIDRVTASPPKGQAVEYHPFFSIKHARDRDAGKAFWNGSRRPTASTPEAEGHGTDVFLSLVDLAFRPSGEAGWVVEVETTCLNRDLPMDLPFGAGSDRTGLQFREGGGLIARISCLTPPTPTLRPTLNLREDLRRGLLWRVISHLSLNHLSLVGAPGAGAPGDPDFQDSRADALREVLMLYDFANSEESRDQIEGIVGIGARRVVGRIRDGDPVAFGRGLEVTIQFDADHYASNNLFLFASVLERFLALYANINSFTKLIATVKGRNEDLCRWPPRMGENVLV